MAAKYRYPIRRSPRSDPQQYRVYRMENEAIGARHYQRLNRATIMQIIRSVCRNYSVPRLPVVWKPLGRWAAMWVQDDAGRIELQLNTKKATARATLTITHELAHHVHEHLAGSAADHHESHGPEFMACHISILDTCRVIPVVGMRAVCQAWNVRYHDPGTTNSLRKLQRIVRRRSG